MNRVKVFRWWLRGMFQRVHCWLVKPPSWVALPDTEFVFHVREDGAQLVLINTHSTLPMELLPLGWAPPKFGGHYEVRVRLKLLGKQITGENMLGDPAATIIEPILLRDLEDPSTKAGFWRKKP